MSFRASGWRPAPRLEYHQAVQVDLRHAATAAIVAGSSISPTAVGKDAVGTYAVAATTDGRLSSTTVGAEGTVVRFARAAAAIIVACGTVGTVGTLVRFARAAAAAIIVASGTRK